MHIAQRICPVAGLERMTSLTTGSTVRGLPYLATQVDELGLSSVKHLGNYVNSDMTDKTDCDMKCSSFIGYVNKLKANFGYLQPFLLDNLFKTFCCAFYGSPLWGFNSLSLKKNARPGISVRDLFLTYLTEHILFFLAHYCNNRMSVNNCILEVPSFYIICIILVIVLCRHVL